jgi:hypothetical protein
MRATLLAGGQMINRGRVPGLRTIDIAPTIAYMMRIPMPQHSQGAVCTDLIKGGSSLRGISIVGLNDFHGQLEQTTLLMDNLAVGVGGASQLATMFDEEASNPGRSALVGRRRQRRGLARQLRPAAGFACHRRRERLGPGRHLVRQP